MFELLAKILARNLLVGLLVLGFSSVQSVLSEAEQDGVNPHDARGDEVEDEGKQDAEVVSGVPVDEQHGCEGHEHAVDGDVVQLAFVEFDSEAQDDGLGDADDD